LALAAAAGPALGECRLTKLGELPVTMVGSAPVVSAKINGADVKLIADSGAFFSILSPAAAERLKLRVGPVPVQFHVYGVNGEARVGMTTARDFSILGNTFHNTDFLVGGSGAGGRAADGLLGQNVLNTLDAEYDLANGVIRLFHSEGCSGGLMAYWAGKDQAFSVIPIEAVEPGSRRIESSAAVNGVKIRVVFDTGAWRSILTKRAAARAGVKTDGPEVQAAGLAGGLGRKSVDTFIAPFDSFAIGQEEVKNTRLRIGDIELQEADMLLGADFFLSHRVFVSNSQRKLFFTYNGGPVFRLDRALAPLAEAQVPEPPPSEASGEPTDAAGYSRRAAAFMARRDFTPAIADYSKAIELEPREPRHLLDRAGARLGNRQPFLAMADLEEALKLKPDFVPALLRRGGLRLGARDLAGARSDFETAVAIDPKARLTVAESYAGAGLTDDAIAQYDLWIAAYSKDDAAPFAFNQRCWIRALSGKELDKALADCDEALRLKPHTSSFLDSRGLVRLRLGELDKAISDYDESLKLQPKGAWSLYGRGLAELKKGMRAEGDADLKAAAEIQPRLPDDAKRHGLTP
jgi:tetratricopeptide (TPR) repeat protein